MYHSNQIPTLRPGKISLFLCALGLFSVPFYVTASVVEGISTYGGDANLVDIWYRCDSVECEFEADLDQQLASEAVEFYWEFSDGSELITSDPFVNHSWEIDGEKSVKLSVYDQYCELYYSEADFDLQTPLFDPDITDEIDVADGDDAAGDGDVADQGDTTDQGDVTNEDGVVDEDDDVADLGDDTNEGGVVDEDDQVNALTSALVLVGQDTLRSASEPLQDVQVRGDTYIYIEELPNARQVSFSLTNESSEKVKTQLERSAPYDLAGGSVLEAKPLDTRLLEDGRYHLDITATYLDSRVEYLTVSFNIVNALVVTIPEPDDADEHADGGDGDEPGDIADNSDVTDGGEVDSDGEVVDGGDGESNTLTSTQLRIAQNKSRAESKPLQDYQVQGDAYIFINELPDAKQVSFALFSQASEKLVNHLERYAPYDLVGGSSLEAKPFDTRSLDDGSYRLDVTVTNLDSSVQNLTVNFYVSNPVVATQPALEPDSGITDIAGDDDEATDDLADDVVASDDVDVSDDVVASDDVDVSDDVVASDDVDVSDDVVASDDVGVSDDAAADVVVGGDNEIDNLTTTRVRIGQNSSRVDSSPLEGYQVQGDVYIFVDDLTRAKQVSLTLYNQASERVSGRVERSAPYDLAGGSVLEAKPFDTRTLEDGTYSLDVIVKYSDNRTEQLIVPFSVFNTPIVPQPETDPEVDIVQNDHVDEPSSGAAQPEDLTGEYNLDSELVFSTRSNRSNSSELAGAVLEGNTYIYLTGAEEADSVEFFVNDISMDEAPIKVEKYAPWDASGGSASRASPFKTKNLDNGQHVLSVRIVEGGQSHVMHASFSIDN